MQDDFMEGVGGTKNHLYEDSCAKRGEGRIKSLVEKRMEGPCVGRTKSA